MSRLEVRATLTNVSYPFYSEELSATVLVSQNNQELNRIPIRGYDGEDAETSYGIPQSYYMQNVLPTTRGYSSVDFPLAIPAHPFGPSVIVDSMYVLRDVTNNISRTVLFAPAKGSNLIFDPNFGGWLQFPFAQPSDKTVTVAAVQGKAYIYYAETGAYAYNFNTGAFAAVALTGIDTSKILGLCGGGLYLVAWDKKTVYWGGATSATNTNFTPSLITGAGSTNLIGARYTITTILPLADGYVAYTEGNAIGATNSNNIISPWIFREIPGSSGVIDSNHVTYESNLDFHMAWTTSGFQQINFRQAQLVWAELSDVLMRGIISQYNIVTNRIDTVIVNKSDIRINNIGSRYTTVSMREKNSSTEFMHSYVFDWSNQRWGRLRVGHVDFFDLRQPAIDVPVTYSSLLVDGTTYQNWLDDDISYSFLLSTDLTQGLGDTFGTVRADGSIYAAAYNLSAAYIAPSVGSALTEQACIFLGKYKQVRGKNLILQELQVDSDFFGTINAYSIDSCGDIAQSLQVADIQSPQLTNRYLTRFYGDSIAVSLHGDFNLTDLLLIFSGAGTRNAPRREVVAPPPMPVIINQSAVIGVN